jgi:multidrug efflux pump subunit AcrA (membrane-fusion protein)
LLFVPVRQSVLAPAEVIPISPVAVSAPLDGVIKAFLVSPNETVSRGQVLFTFDDTSLRNQRDIAQRSLKVSEAEYNRTRQLAFNDSKQKAEIDLLRTRIELRRTELNFTEELLQRSVVHASQSGVAIFNDPNDWIGQQVATGQKILELADPGKVQLQAWVPTDDAINLQTGAAVKLFLNIDPLAALSAKLTETSYTPAVNVDGILGFPIKAEFEDPDTLPRLGLRGTAKIHGETVSMGYYLFRRPISAVRRVIGM